MAHHDAATLFAGCALGIFLFTILAAWRAATFRRLTMKLDDVASALVTATAGINNVATALNTAAGAIGAAGDTAALDQPVADLGSAVTALQTAAQAVTDALPH